jgi:hypothetical protein
MITILQLQKLEKDCQKVNNATEIQYGDIKNQRSKQCGK